MRDSRDVMNIIAKTPPGQNVKIMILHQGKKSEIQAAVGKRPPLRSQADRRG
jgi:hypothetical protein